VTLIFEPFGHIHLQEHNTLPVIKIIHVYLMPCIPTSGVPIDNLTVASCAQFILRKVTKCLCSNLDWNFLMMQKRSWGLFLPSSAIGGLNYWKS